MRQSNFDHTTGWGNSTSTVAEVDTCRLGWQVVAEFSWSFALSLCQQNSKKHIDYFFNMLIISHCSVQLLCIVASIWVCLNLAGLQMQRLDGESDEDFRRRHVKYVSWLLFFTSWLWLGLRLQTITGTQVHTSCKLKSLRIRQWLQGLLGPKGSNLTQALNDSAERSHILSAYWCYASALNMWLVLGHCWLWTWRLTVYGL